LIAFSDELQISRADPDIRQCLAHALSAPKGLQGEIIQGGFELVDIQASDENKFAGAIGRKPL